MLISTLVDPIVGQTYHRRLTAYVNFYSRRSTRHDSIDSSLTAYVNFYSRRYKASTPVYYCLTAYVNFYSRR